MGYTVASYIAARFVSSVRTMREVRGCWSRYFLTVFLDSATSTARTINPLSPNSFLTLSTNPDSSKQYTHHVVQNSSRTTFPLTDSFVNFSPSIVLALNRGAASFVLGPATAARAVKNNNRLRAVPRKMLAGVG